jgi:hypothetical protein
LTKEPKTNFGEKAASLRNSAGKTGYPHVKDWNKTPVSHTVLISMQSGDTLKLTRKE